MDIPEGVKVEMKAKQITRLRPYCYCGDVHREQQNCAVAGILHAVAAGDASNWAPTAVRRILTLQDVLADCGA